MRLRIRGKKFGWKSAPNDIEIGEDLRYLC